MNTDLKAARFSTDNLAAFERHGATVTQRRAGHPGCWVELPNGWTLSIQWGGCMYGSNYDRGAGDDVPDALQAEIAVWKGDSGLITWHDGDTVQGWCSMGRVQRILDLLAEDALLCDPDPSSVEKVADDGWRDPSE